LSEFCKRFGFKPGTRVYVDDGVSAWQGLNATPDHELGKFLADARKGLIRPGDCLLIENYDRLSRQDPWAAIGLVSELRSLRIHVGRLDRMKLLRYDSKDYGDFFEAAVEFMRGNSESEAKSMRNREAWKRKRKAARENGETFTRQLPAWIEEKDGERILKPEYAGIMKRVFQLTASGYGHALIVKRFTSEGVPHFRGKHWTRSYISRLLTDRRALGEFQPRLRDGTKAGEVIKGYYPAAVTEEEWNAARAGAAQRIRHRGRVGQYINIFAGLLKNAAAGDSYFAATWQKNGRQKRILANNAAADGRATLRTFPFEPFEKAILSLLREIDPHSILNGDSGPDETLGLSGELLKVEAELGDAVAFMNEHGFSVAIGKRVSELETRKSRLAEQLAEARQKARHPLSETWGEFQTLADVLDIADDPNDVRLRIQGG
jgi:DNA invertase Pin-like site-specific DNA recombinase